MRTHSKRSRLVLTCLENVLCRRREKGYIECLDRNVVSGSVDEASASVSLLGLVLQVAKEVVLSKYEDYGSIQQEIHVRVVNLPVVDLLRDLRHVHLGVLVKVCGVVTRRTGVFPQLKISHFNCGKCGSVIGPFSNVSDKVCMCVCGWEGECVNVLQVELVDARPCSLLCVARYVCWRFVARSRLQTCVPSANPTAHLH